MRSLVKQLAVGVHKGEIHDEVVKFYDKKCKDGFSSAKMRFEEADDLLLELIQAFPRVYILIDALDECYEEDRLTLIESFNRLISALPHVKLKVFISSRRNDSIARQLRKGANIGVEATNNGSDIARFVIDRIEMDNLRRIRQSMPPISEDLKHEIASVFGYKSHGM